jgi:hypothetical protein
MSDDDDIEFCIVCHAPSKPPPVSGLTHMSWLRQWYFVSPQGDVLPAGKYIGRGQFNHKDHGLHYTNTRRRLDYNWQVPSLYGVFLHVSCYDVIGADEGIGRLLWHLLRNVDPDTAFGNILPSVDYGKISDYCTFHSAYEYTFDVDTCLADGNGYMLQDPRKAGKNRKRILDIWKAITSTT